MTHRISQFSQKELNGHGTNGLHMDSAVNLE